MAYGLAFTGITLWVYLLVALVCIVAGVILKIASSVSKTRDGMHYKGTHRKDKE